MQHDPDSRSPTRKANSSSINSPLLTSADSPAANNSFEVASSRLVTGPITEGWGCAASEEGILGMYPEERGCRDQLS